MKRLHLRRVQFNMASSSHHLVFIFVDRNNNLFFLLITRTHSHRYQKSPQFSQLYKNRQTLEREWFYAAEPQPKSRIKVCEWDKKGSSTFGSNYYIVENQSTNPSLPPSHSHFNGGRGRVGGRGGSHATSYRPL